MGKWSFRADCNCERFWAWGRIYPFFLSVNEGRTPINLAVGWLFKGHFMFYLLFFGHRIVWQKNI